MVKRLFVVLVGLFLVTAVPVRGEAVEPYEVVCTVGMIADVAREVVGDRGRVRGLIGEGIDPHLYKPTRDDVVALRRADVVFYNGLKLEGKMGDILARVARDGRPVVAVTERIERDRVLIDEGHDDPHVWMDVSLWKQAVDVITDTLVTFDAAGASDYRARAEAYKKELDRLDRYARECAASIPEARRVLVTAHDAFGYFGRAYGFNVRGIQGLSTESEAGLRDINTLVDLLVDSGISAVFVESSVADKNVRALVEGASSRGHTVGIGGELFSDAMGKGGTYEGTYLGMIDHNVTTITRALGGTAPERGLNGRLAESGHEG